MNLHLTDKIALVTGASSGIGAAAARVLAEEGADVIVCYHQDEDGARRVAEAVRAQGRQSWLCRMDIGDPASIAAAVGQVKEQVPGLDIVILCAGHNIVTPFAQITPDEWSAIIDTNLSGPFYLVQALNPLLRDGAAVVAVSSVAAHTGAPHHLHYAAAKAGLENLVKSLARALAPRVRVNCVSPGITLTPMGEDTVRALAPDYAQQKLLVQRYASPDEIARCIVFIASPLAGFMTGATVDINGGRDLR